MKVVLDDDTTVTDYSQVKLEVVKHFGKLPGSGLFPSTIVVSEIDPFIQCEFTPGQAGFLSLDVTSSEIKEAMFLIKNGKSPGPDGFNANFFKTYWHIIGNEATLGIQSFLSSCLISLT